MGYRLTFLMDQIFTNKKIRTNYLIKNKNFVIVFLMFFTLYSRYLISQRINEVKVEISKENKKLRSLRQLL